MNATERRARIALYGAGGSPFHHLAIFARAGHDVDAVFPADIANGALAGFDAFVMPGGGYRAMFGQIEPLGADGARAIREYVESGGMYIGCCAGTYDAATVAESFLALCPAQGEMCLLDATVCNDGRRGVGPALARHRGAARTDGRARASGDGRDARGVRDRALQRPAVRGRRGARARGRPHRALHRLGGDARQASGARPARRRGRRGGGEHRRRRARRRARRAVRLAPRVRLRDRDGGRTGCRAGCCSTRSSGSCRRTRRRARAWIW